jgi:hypothetical protein
MVTGSAAEVTTTVTSRAAAHPVDRPGHRHRSDDHAGRIPHQSSKSPEENDMERRAFFGAFNRRGTEVSQASGS